MQSCLEKRSMTARHEMEVRSDYNRQDQYSETHPDALASSGKGKGTGVPGGVKNILPNCKGPMGMIDYSNFDTAISSGAGNADDNAARNKALTRSLYNEENVYSEKLVNTAENLAEGQYRTY